MTNKEKILRYLSVGLKVKVTKGDKEFLIVHYFDSKDRFIYISNNGYCDSVSSDSWEDYTLTPIAHKPDFKIGDKVLILDIAREIDGFDEWDNCYKDMVGTIGTITHIGNDIHVKGSHKYPVGLRHWALAPAFDEEDPKDKAIQELEEKMKELQSEIDKLKS